MAIRAVVFDIGGVLEITPDLGIDRLWETRLGLPAGEILVRMRDIWRDGSIGTITCCRAARALYSPHAPAAVAAIAPTPMA